MGGLTDPALLAVMAVAGIAVLRFGLWWLLLAPILRLMLRPVPLFLIAVALAAALRPG